MTVLGSPPFLCGSVLGVGALRGEPLVCSEHQHGSSSFALRTLTRQFVSRVANADTAIHFAWPRREPMSTPSLRELTSHLRFCHGCQSFKALTSGLDVFLHAGFTKSLQLGHDLIAAGSSTILYMLSTFKQPVRLTSALCR